MQCRWIGHPKRAMWIKRWKQKQHLDQPWVKTQSFLYIRDWNSHFPNLVHFFFPNVSIIHNYRNKSGPGSHMGLQLMLNADVADYYCSSTHSAGFKILLHSPNETPRISEFGMFVAPGRENRILVSPRINSASRLIRNINIEQRQCVFANEANLTYFRTYTRRVSTSLISMNLGHFHLLNRIFLFVAELWNGVL